MKYATIPPQSKVDAVLKSKDWIMQEKYDGAWYQLEKTDDGKIYLFGRTLSKVTGEYTEKIDNVPWLKDWAKFLPNGTTLIGEIYIPGGHSNDVTKIMGCLPEKAIERQKTVHVQYMVFDCIRYNGEDLCNEPFVRRFEHYIVYMLGDLFSSSCALDGYYEEDPHVKIANTWKIEQESDEFKKDYSDILRDIFARGGEGCVFKHKDSIYRPGMRTTTSQMFKCKEHVDSIDLVIMDVLDPEMEYTGKEIETWPYWAGNCESDNEWFPLTGNDKKFIPKLQKDKFYSADCYCVHHHSMNFCAVTKHWYYGWKNALKVGAYDNEGKLVEVGRVASGLTDEIRADLGANPNNYIGNVCQLSCMSLNKEDFTIRHPVFEQFRFDKNANDCKIEEIFS